MKIAVGGDHAGFPMKAPVVEHLKSLGHEVTDHGTHSEDPVDFPDIAQKVTAAILSGEADRGVLVCGTGVGAAIAGNKVPGIRAALAHDTHCAHQGVEHDDVNLICIGAWIIGIAVAKEVLEAFVNAEFSSDPDFRRRVDKLSEMERKYARELVGSD
ncbi:MAG TPA: ribose 5-phosphate isomerase B [Dehalococcoidia bacterium]|jgi:ribose 5-phosphate isomerase B|nr:ribose 5-phosphate isomerase B [Dehalococcoidia bacterium]MEE2841413.1 ribose 5-phosphate isomerase B [Chloroflexota bacterium]MQG30120.1 ribose 5-phosphate isomerase B [SAR202 cluster bacterium]HIM59133.1 ribose 5-phosphate isomerase B [Dehalococcoidia bacterium]|tara:strand:- start:288 stop:758 length:471 start_codon:yes stop_codon:yes gene_type:complete